MRERLLRIKMSSAPKRIAVHGDASQIYQDQLVTTFNSIFHKYDKLEKYSNQELIFYPLHYEPEAVLNYISEFNDNQEAFIENLAKCIGQNQLLVVKEHPNQPGRLLLRRYRGLKKRVSNVLFLPAEAPTKEIIKQSKLLITQTSTAGMEGLIIEKPVIVFGKIFYDQHPQINKVTSFKEVRHIIRKETWKTPTTEDNIQFLAKVAEYSKEGNPFPHADLYDPQNIKHVVQAIEEQLKKEIEKREEFSK